VSERKRQRGRERRRNLARAKAQGTGAGDREEGARSLSSGALAWNGEGGLPEQKSTKLKQPERLKKPRSAKIASGSAFNSGNLPSGGLACGFGLESTTGV